VLGMGFVLEPEEAESLINKDSRNREVLFPYLNGEDLNSRWDQSASRWVINFRDWPLERAGEYTECFEIVERLVRPDRVKLPAKPDSSAQGYAAHWWQFGRKGLDLYASMASLNRVLVVSLVTHHVGMALVLASSFSPTSSGYLQSEIQPRSQFFNRTFHEPWARAYSSSLETRINYSPSWLRELPVPDRVGVYRVYRRTLPCVSTRCNGYSQRGLNGNLQPIPLPTRSLR
jgi:hypothetical protein